MPNTTNPFAPKFLPWNPVINPRKQTPFGLNFDPTSIVDQRRLGVNPKQSFPQQQGDPSTAPPAESEWNFMDEYAKATGNKPNRLAYQQAIEEGSPVIDRGKWAKFGAAFSAGASALGGAPADRAAKFGLDAYYAPQGRSDERYDKKVAGLGKLAALEDTDRQEKVEMLKAQRDDQYKKSAEKRADSSQKIAENAASLNMELTAAELAGARYDLEHKGEYSITDKTTGITTRYDRNHKPITGASHQTDWTPEQEAQRAQTLAKAEALGKTEGTEAVRQSERDIEEIKAGAKKKIAEDNRKQQKELALLRMQQTASKSDPKSAYLAVINQLTEDMNGDRISPKAASWIKEGELGNLTVERPIWAIDFGDNRENDLAEQEARQWVSAAMAKQTAKPEVKVPEAAPAGPSAAATASGAKANPDGTVTVYAPTGQKKDLSPEEAEAYVSQKGASYTPPNQPVVTPNAVAAPAPPAPVPPPVGNVPPPAAAAPSVPIPPPANNKINFNSIQNQTPPRGVPPIAPQGLFGLQEGSNPTLANSFRMGQNAPPANINPSSLAPPQAPVAPSQGQMPLGINIPPQQQAPPPNPIQLSQPPIPPPQQAPVGPPPMGVNLNPKNLGNVPPQMGVVPPQQRQPLINPIQLGGNKPPAAPQQQTGEQQFNSILETVKARVKKETGLDLKVISARRSAEKQAQLYAVGRGKNDKRPTVTDADGYKGLSKHQDGRATDLRFVTPDGKITEGDKKLQGILGRIAKEEGLDWGGDWKKRYDPLHIELSDEAVGKK